MPDFESLTDVLRLLEKLEVISEDQALYVVETWLKR
jgi:hypothetical protein